jgi:glyoxylase-like metal-dependent hydrolase (beta-lactamase superfamily II)
MKRLLVFTILLGLTAAIGFSQALVKTGDRAKRGYKETDFPRAKQLAPGVYSYEALRGGDPGGQMTTVSLIVITTDGVLVADGQGNVAQTQEMVDWIKKTTNQPIKYVVVCSDHGDHTGGNSAFPQTATFIAHPTSKQTMEAAAANQGRGGRGGRGRGDRGGAAPATPPPPPRLPTETVADRRVMKMGNTDIEILFLGRAHTGGDLSVYLPREKVLFMSEAYLHRIFPAMRSAYPSEWVAAIRKAEAMNATWYIPGHGFVDDAATLKQELPVYRKALEHVIAEGKRLHAAKVPCPTPAAGTPADQAPPCVAAEQAKWGDLNDWTLRQGQAPIALRKVYEELDGKLK